MTKLRFAAKWLCIAGGCLLLLGMTICGQRNYTPIHSAPRRLSLRGADVYILFFRKRARTRAVSA